MSLRVDGNSPVRSASSSGNPLQSHSLIGIGSQGAEVRDLQQRLKTAGYDVAASGQFDEKTLAAVKKYQGDKGLLVDGKVGQQTWGSFFGIKAPPGTEMLGRATSPGAPAGTGYSPKDTFEPGKVGGPSGGSNSAKLQWAMNVARQMGLTITSTTGGRHAPGSYHYQGRAFDVAGSPSQMARFYDAMKAQRPTEAFYDPRGGIKFGNEIGAIGGHSDHVHVAF